MSLRNPLWRWATPVVVGASLAFDLVYRGLIGRDAIARVSERYEVSLAPARYTYGISIAVFLALGALGVRLSMPKRRGELVYDEVAPLVWMVSILIPASSVLFAAGLLLPSAAIQLATTIASLFLYARINGAIKEGETRASRAPCSLLVGWSTFMLLVGASVALVSQNVLPGLLEHTWAAVMLLVATGGVAMLSLRARDWVAPLALAWGAMGVFVARAIDGSVLVRASALTSFLTCIGLAATLFFARHRHTGDAR